MPDLKDLAIDHFKSQVGSDFRCTQGEKEMDLRLATADTIDTAQKLADGQRKPFSLTFRGSREEPLEQGIYTLDHEGMGQQELFLVPVHEDDEGRYYEAVFT